MTKLTYCLLATGDGSITCSLMERDCGEAPDWGPLPKESRIIEPLGNAGTITQSDKPSCYGVSYSGKKHCGCCEWLGCCGELWSYKSWNTRKRIGYGRQDISLNNSWDNVVRVIEDEC